MAVFQSFAGQGQHGFDDVVDLRRRRAAFGRTIKVQRPRDNRDQPLHLFLGHVQVAQSLLVRQWAIEDEVQTVLNSLQRVVDFVCDGSGQPAGGGELFGLDELRLRTFQLLLGLSQLAVQSRVFERHAHRRG